MFTIKALNVCFRRLHTNLQENYYVCIYINIYIIYISIFICMCILVGECVFVCVILGMYKYCAFTCMIVYVCSASISM